MTIHRDPQPMTGEAPTPVPTASEPAAASRVPLVATALSACSLVIAGIVMWAPWGRRNAWAYADVAPHRDGAWNALVVDAVALVGIGVTFAVLTCMLAPGRGRNWAVIGSVLAIAGAALAAAGELSSATLNWYATSAGLSRHDGTALLVWTHHHSAHTYGANAAGFVLFTLGSLALAGALIRARALPIAAPIVFMVLTVSQFVGSGRLQDVTEAATMLSLAVIGLLALRGARSGREGVSDA